MRNTSRPRQLPPSGSFSSSSPLLWEAARDNGAGDAILEHLDSTPPKLVKSLGTRERLEQALDNLHSFPVSTPLQFRDLAQTSNGVLGRGKPCM